MRRILTAATLAALMAAGCVSTDEVGGSNRPTPTTAPPPTEVGTIGTDVVNGGVEVAVLDIAAFNQSPKGVPRLRVVMRAENLSDSEQVNPDVQLTCAESKKVGEWFLGSTWEPNAGLPVNAVTEGQVIVGFPLKGDNPEYPVVSCTSARLLVVVDDARSSERKVVSYAIDDAITAQAAKAPRGPKLPLPADGS